jgi:phosphoglycerol transferase MdoB-like AlkP superfamily enzyme
MFFKQASTQSWYNNTLFVITPDHNYLAGNNSDNNYFHEGLGLFSIPVIFYIPGNPNFKANNRTVFQQIDIMPTILDLIHYPHSFFAYGKSAFDTLQTPYTYCLIDNYHYMLVNDRVVGGIEEKIDGIYNFSTDSLLTKKLPSDDSLSFLATKRYKAFRQLLTSTISQNKQSIRTYK